MEIIYKCDVCGKQERWITGIWIAHIYLIGQNHEHEFHLCSKECDDKLSAMSKKERKTLIANY